MTQWLRNTTRARIYARDTPEGQKSPACTYCGRAVLIGRLPSDSESGLAAAVVDHVDPNGGNKPKNLVTACWSCNAEKGKRTPEEWEDSRLEAGHKSSKPRWRSRRPEPAGNLTARARAAGKRPFCPQKEPYCSAQLELIEDRRTAAAEAARRRR